MNGIWFIQIDNLMYYKCGTWVRYNEGQYNNYYLRIHFDQLFITNGEKIVETLSGKLKGFFRDNIFILIIVNTEKKIRKIRFRIQFSDIAQSVNKLGRHFPLVNQKDLQRKYVQRPLYRKLEDAIQLGLRTDKAETELKLPPNYEDFVKLCLLDPGFPLLVNETKKIVDKISADVL